MMNLAKLMSTMKHPVMLYGQEKTTPTLLGILVLLSNYLHILNSSFSIPTYYFKLMTISSEDMSRNAMLEIISKY